MSKGAAQSGVLVIDKPRGPTSHDVVARVRKALKTRHVGHTGTLDPMATGVLVLAIGEGTKLVPWLTAADKAYDATIRLGIATNTLDAEGEVMGAPQPIPDEILRFISDPSRKSDLLDAAIAAERQRTMQAPPAYSAIRIDGVRAHELARAGELEDADLPARPVEVRMLEALGGRVSKEHDAIELDVRVEASKGYFVRSLARDLSMALGTVGHLTALRRTRSGAFTIADAALLENVTGDVLMSTATAATRALPVTILDSAGVRAATFGQRVAPEHMKDPHPCPSAWLDESAHLIAIGACEPDGSGRVLRGFPSTT